MANDYITQARSEMIVVNYHKKEELGTQSKMEHRYAVHPLSNNKANIIQSRSFSHMETLGDDADKREDEWDKKKKWELSDIDPRPGANGANEG